MTDEFKAGLKEAGVDMERTLGRFLNNEAMYERFLHKLLGDQTFFALEQAVSEKDMEQITQASHTLKGVYANLGLDPLAAVMGELLVEARAENAEPMDALFTQAKEQYALFTRLISQHLG